MTIIECAHGPEPVELEIAGCEACGGDRAGIGIGCTEIPDGDRTWRHLCNPCFLDLAAASYERKE